MIVSRTPYRISFFGGGTDYPDWYTKNGGSVLSTTINKYCYISAKYNTNLDVINHKIIWSHIENVYSFKDILHPAVREGLLKMQMNETKGLEIYHSGDLPARTGIGSSSSFCVGLINSLANLNEKPLNETDLALKAIELEQNILNEKVGSQDQIAASFGGFNKIIFNKDSSFNVEKIEIKQETLSTLNKNMSLYYTGTRIGRNSSDVISDMVNNFDSNYSLLTELESFVEEGIALLKKSDISNFGKLLNESWKIKKSLGKEISNEHINEIYDTAINCGAYGGKILGAGGAGFIMFIIPESNKTTLKEKLKNCTEVPFEFENSGSKIILNSKSV
ncbi:MAG: kinase [Chloroflexi bacterium]|nr:kinase [Chloroflexota bacterium]